MKKTIPEARVPPSAKVLRQLYVLSGNLCAKPQCNSVLVNANGTFVGEVCHIKAERPNGARYDKTLSEEQRRAAENLILLCSTCHTLVDSEPKKFTVGLLTKWKREREARFQEVGDTLRQSYIKNIRDEADYIDLSVPLTLNAFTGYLDEQNIIHNIDETTPKEIAEYVDQLKHVSMPDRLLIVTIIEKAIAMGGGREYEHGIAIHPDDLKTIIIDNSRLSDYRIGKLGKTLERNHLGYLDADEEPSLSLKVPCSGLGWSELKEFLESSDRSLKDLLCDLKFGLLD
jgi:hypothetical protein